MASHKVERWKMLSARTIFRYEKKMFAALETLFLPLEKNEVAWPQGRTLFLGAMHHPFLSKIDVDLWQPSCPASAGLKTLPIIPDQTYAMAFILIPKQAEEAKFWLSQALVRLPENGTLVAAAANDAGGSRLAGWLKEIGLSPISISKNKCRVVYAQKGQNIDTQTLQSWLSNGQIQDHDFGDGLRLKTQPGLFSWSHIDPGSNLLTHHIQGLSGQGADFGCGIGYLSYRLLETNHEISKITLIDADARALDCAKSNIPSYAETNYIWADLTRPVRDLSPLDFIVMNPPFHTGKMTESTIGQSFIATAAHHLKKGGILRMVANAHLPYESMLNQLFKDVRVLVQEKGYKIIEAVK